MTANTPMFSFASTDLILEIPTTVEQFPSPTNFQVNLNQVCLGAVLPWLQEDYTPEAKVWPNAPALSSFWELVNGTAVTVDATRFILVPSEDIDSSELRLPQEWVDLSSWAGDYYLAAQVVAEQGYVRVWGYCTHEALKTKGSYQPSDRTYALDRDYIITDMTVLGVVRKFCADEVTRVETVEIPNLPQAQAENLIARLGNPEIITPRLAVPFSLWGGLMEHGGWRQRLYEKRLGLPEQHSVIQWLQSGVSEIAAAMGWEKLNLEFRAAGARSKEEGKTQVSLSRQLTIAGQLYELLITPQGQPNTTHWRFELRNTTVGGAIPGGFKLRLLTEDLQPFPNNEDIAKAAVQQLYIEVALEPGEGIVWEVEPLPDNYDREILKF
ncbi:Uncharacterized protein apha_01299 [Umezakia ovalisporum]|uniref:DUF1822 family protein n=1 Tax=Umezakia ovalisporum TaxID=75695 RepID=UPI0006EF7DA4|nr:Uncharacterized protein apha_01299 [Umezakia ovalisporum]